MILLLYTHVLLWAAGLPERLSVTARNLIGDPTHTPIFSVASLWEITIKRGLNRPDFDVDARLLRQTCLENGYEELTIEGDHALAVATLPHLHRDPFDRLLIAQAHVEGTLLLTADAEVAAYPGPIRAV